MSSSASFHHGHQGYFWMEKSNFLFDWLLCLHELSTIKSIIIVPPCLVWVLCVKELSGWRKSHHLPHGSAFAFLWRKVEWWTYKYMWMNIHFRVPAHSLLWGKCHKVYHLGLEHVVNKYEQPYKQGPYLIMQVNTNGTVCLKIGAVTDTINIRHIHPYKMMSTIANNGGEYCMHHSAAQAKHM